MRTSRALGLVFLATAALAQQPQSVEITSEPSHHLVFQNEYVRVFDVTVAPKATTLIHKHNYDYLFVTLGDSDVVSTRVNEKPVALKLKDGEVRFTPGHFAHAAMNESDRPFHNTTIELLKPSTNVKTCAEACITRPACPNGGSLCPEARKLISADQWSVALITIPPAGRVATHTHTTPHLVVPVSVQDLTIQTESSSLANKRAVGEISWVTAGVTHSVINNSSQSARFVVLEFNPEKPQP